MIIEMLFTATQLIAYRETEIQIHTHIYTVIHIHVMQHNVRSFLIVDTFCN